jgi:hypothetical protein
MSVLIEVDRRKDEHDSKRSENRDDEKEMMMMNFFSFA